MSTLSQFTGGSQRVAQVVNNSSSGGAYDVSDASGGGCKHYVMGAVTANTLKTALSISGAGAVNLVKCCAQDSVTRSMRLKITIDARVIYDATTSVTTFVGTYGLIGVGSADAYSTSRLFTHQRIPFENSLLVEFASSLSEAGTNLIVGVNYEVNA